MRWADLLEVRNLQVRLSLVCFNLVMSSLDRCALREAPGGVAQCPLGRPGAGAHLALCNVCISRFYGGCLRAVAARVWESPPAQRGGSFLSERTVTYAAAGAADASAGIGGLSDAASRACRMKVYSPIMLSTAGGAAGGHQNPKAGDPSNVLVLLQEDGIILIVLSDVSGERLAGIAGAKPLPPKSPVRRRGHLLPGSCGYMRPLPPGPGGLLLRFIIASENYQELVCSPISNTRLPAARHCRHLLPGSCGHMRPLPPGPGGLLPYFISRESCLQQRHSLMTRSPAARRRRHLAWLLPLQPGQVGMCSSPIGEGTTISPALLVEGAQSPSERRASCPKAHSARTSSGADHLDELAPCDGTQTGGRAQSASSWHTWTPASPTSPPLWSTSC